MPSTSEVLIGRTLTLNVGTRGWNENLSSTGYYGAAVPPVSTTVIRPGQAFTLALPGQLPVDLLWPVTRFWTSDPFSQGTCSVQAEQYSDPA